MINEASLPMTAAQEREIVTLSRFVELQAAGVAQYLDIPLLALHEEFVKANSSTRAFIMKGYETCST